MNPSGHIEVGQRAPEFELPAADRHGVVSLAQYRGKFAVLLALFRGLYCPFCRRQMAQLSPVADRLRAIGIETVGVVATAPERARLYFRLRPSRYPLGADPDLITHRAYGLPVIERNDEAAEMVERAAQRLAAELHIEAPPGQGRVIVDAADGFERLESDGADRLRHQIQLIGQFLIDRDGVIRGAGLKIARGTLCSRQQRSYCRWRSVWRRGMCRRPRWLVTCSCGWGRECVSAWAAVSVSRLHQQLGEVGVEHVMQIEEPEGPAGKQLLLV